MSELLYSNFFLVDADVHISTIICNNWHFTLHVLSILHSVYIFPVNRVMPEGNPPRGCTARVTVVCWPHFCMCVCLSVCLLPC